MSVRNLVDPGSLGLIAGFVASGSPERRARVARRAMLAGLGLVVPVLAVAAWWVSAAHDWLPQQILPPPAFVWQTFRDMVGTGELAGHIGISLLRVVEGFALGAVIGLLLGVSMGLSPLVDDYLRPLVTAFAQVPTLGWIPLLMLLLGIDEALKVVVIAQAAFVPMVINTSAGIRAVPAGLVEVARAFRFTRWQLVRKLMLPAAVPPIFTGIRYGLTHAWKALVGVELLASAEGLGYLLVWGRQMFWLDLVLVAMIVIGILGFLMDHALKLAEQRLQRWRFVDG